MRVWPEFEEGVERWGRTTPSVSRKRLTPPFTQGRLNPSVPSGQLPYEGEPTIYSASRRDRIRAVTPPRRPPSSAIPEWDS